MNRSTRPRFQRNRGAILFVALIMLLLLTLLGITSMQVTMLQERMSGNFRAQQIAFERAEGRMSEGRDLASDLLRAYDEVSGILVGLSPTDDLPWAPWLSAYPPSTEYEIQTRHCGGACPDQRGSIVSDDPNKKPRFYVISAQEKDPSSDVENAAWATVQTIYVY